MRKKEISMIILAGGASSRMGRDKSDLTIDGKTFLEMQIEKGEKLGISDILLSGYHGENKYKYPIIPDRFPGKGPLEVDKRAEMSFFKCVTSLYLLE